MNVVVLRLLNGAEIIGEKLSEKTLRNPHLLQFVQGEHQGQIGIQIGPVAPFVEKGEDGNIDISFEFVEFSYVPEKAIVENYIKAISPSSHLVLPKDSGKIILP